MLGISNWRRGRPIQNGGIGGEIKIHQFELYINLPNCRREQAMIGFTAEHNNSDYAGILGSEGFFQFYDVVFEYSSQVTIRPKFKEELSFE